MSRTGATKIAEARRTVYIYRTRCPALVPSTSSYQIYKRLHQYKSCTELYDMICIPSSSKILIQYSLAQWREGVSTSVWEGVERARHTAKIAQERRGNSLLMSPTLPRDRKQLERLIQNNIDDLAPQQPIDGSFGKDQTQGHVLQWGRTKVRCNAM